MILMKRSNTIHQAFVPCTFQMRWLSVDLFRCSQMVADAEAHHQRTFLIGSMMYCSQYSYWQIHLSPDSTLRTVFIV